MTFEESPLLQTLQTPDLLHTFQTPEDLLKFVLSLSSKNKFLDARIQTLTAQANDAELDSLKSDKTIAALKADLAKKDRSIADLSCTVCRLDAALNDEAAKVKLANSELRILKIASKPSKFTINHRITTPHLPSVIVELDSRIWNSLAKNISFNKQNTSSPPPSPLLNRLRKPLRKSSSSPALNIHRNSTSPSPIRSSSAFLNNHNRDLSSSPPPPRPFSPTQFQLSKDLFPHVSPKVDTNLKNSRRSSISNLKQRFCSSSFGAECDNTSFDEISEENQIQQFFGGEGFQKETESISFLISIIDQQANLLEKAYACSDVKFTELGDDDDDLAESMKKRQKEGAIRQLEYIADERLKIAREWGDIGRARDLLWEKEAALAKCQKDFWNERHFDIWMRLDRIVTLELADFRKSQVLEQIRGGEKKAIKNDANGIQKDRLVEGLVDEQKVKVDFEVEQSKVKVEFEDDQSKVKVVFEDEQSKVKVYFDDSKVVTTNLDDSKVFNGLGDSNIDSDLDDSKVNEVVVDATKKSCMRPPSNFSLKKRASGDLLRRAVSFDVAVKVLRFDVFYEEGEEVEDEIDEID